MGIFHAALLSLVHVPYSTQHALSSAVLMWEPAAPG